MELDALKLLDDVLSTLVAKRMLGEPDQDITPAECAQLAKARNHRGRTYRLRAADADAFLLECARVPHVPIVLEGKRFVLAPTERPEVAP